MFANEDALMLLKNNKIGRNKVLILQYIRGPVRKWENYRKGLEDQFNQETKYK